MGQHLDQRLTDSLRELQQRDAYRSLHPTQGIDCSSNDYLRLSRHPEMLKAAFQAIEDGVSLGAGGSRLLRGNTTEHELLEAYAATFFGHERALYVANGYLANYGLLSTLPQRGDMILFDAHIHASARDGIQASAAKHRAIAHNDLNAFESALKSACISNTQSVVVVESVYSMDGDIAPLTQLSELTKQYGATLIVDEAHATGVLGKDGRGLTDTLSRENLITVHTCGKALGVSGGLITASAPVIETLINRCRSFIYTTAPSPLQAVLVQRALELLPALEPEREHLVALRRQLNEGLPHLTAQSHIIPIILGDNATAITAATHLQHAGFDIRAIRPPTVPEGTARLRLSLNAGLMPETLDALIDELKPPLTLYPAEVLL